MTVLHQQPERTESIFWTRHFLENLNHMDEVPWSEDQHQLTSEEKTAISGSIATFQLGESSEGNSFRRAGFRYAEKTGDHEYLRALDLFIREENRHSAVLSQFMGLHGIPEIEKDWTDSIFRKVRKVAGLDLCITVLVTAEIISAIYYDALAKATQSTALKAICEQVLIDEQHHLQFQSATLKKDRASWSPPARWFFRQLQRGLVAATTLVVWKEHGSVYRRGGYSFLEMARKTWRQSERVLAMIAGEGLSK